MNYIQEWENCQTVKDLYTFWEKLKGRAASVMDEEGVLAWGKNSFYIERVEAQIKTLERDGVHLKRFNPAAESATTTETT